MVIWIIFAALATGVTAALLHPLSKPHPVDAGGNVDVGWVYRDQLSEIESELAYGQIQPAEYELAKAEIARRLFRVADASAPRDFVASTGSMFWMKLAVAAVLSVGSISLYVVLGSPDLSSKPLQQRLDEPGQRLAILIRQTEEHLARAPSDGRGWDVIAPIYSRSGRIADALDAYHNVIRLLGPNATRLDGLAETLMTASNGIVTAEARGVLRQSQALDAANPRTLFYLALALEQEGKAAEAKTAFEALAKQSPPDAPWLAAVDEHIIKNGGRPEVSTNGNAPGNPTAEDVAAANALSSGDRQQMIRGMVDSLDTKLKEDPKNFEGWMRLIRSYAVLNDRDRAVDALKRGLAAFPADGGQGQQLLALAKELGLPTEVTQQ
ncbi:c-type cytochrome biogenesis protein CcmI [Rhizobium sp. P28RR-XV]|uniref:c-type cytochrome biogenesis protein CcmI n=1 Tax=Rhizobium sp. P28RR-XV TaxID=2726737 RepID=UPI001456D9E5|nr:c-type cytochrome biogenesis protein CcmI [Rhizobium sp. P28RR-XV]NLR89391.1 c-type cytochrome biogenesis protein CcmI [Rhizobium sp. P28RR-XV]